MGEFINKTTIISGLFYIGRDKWQYSGFPPDVDRYKSWVGNLLKQDINLYFYVDDYYYDFVFEKRKKYDPNFEKTVLIKISLDDLYFYKKYFNQEACLMSSFDFKQTIFHKNSADMNYPLYHIINFSKIEFVKKSFEENKFNSDYFFWVDAGGLRNVINEKNRTWLDTKYEGFNTDKITHFTHNLEFDIYNGKSDYFRSQNRNIQGTAWIVPKDKISLFFDLIDNEVNSIITDRIVGSDEKVYDFLYKSNPELYRLEKCTWFEFYDIVKIKRKKVFLDMGTHKQEGLSHFVNQLNIDKDWDIHCFEPNPLISFDNQFTNLNITLHNKAVWINNGSVIFGQYGDTGVSQGSLIEETDGSKFYQDKFSETKVECIDIYEFIQNLGDVDIYIKMDIEWAEYKVINHIIQNGWSDNIKEMWIEWHGMNNNENVIKKENLIKQIKNTTKLNTWI
jgi:FkbM family methyltransferase